MTLGSDTDKLCSYIPLLVRVFYKNLLSLNLMTDVLTFAVLQVSGEKWAPPQSPRWTSCLCPLVCVCVRVSEIQFRVALLKYCWIGILIGYSLKHNISKVPSQITTLSRFAVSCSRATSKFALCSRFFPFNFKLLLTS